MNAMVGGDEEQLAINVIAKLADLEKQMAKANGITARAFREMTLTTKKATRQMEDDAARSATRINQAYASVGTKIGGVGKAFAAGGIGGLVGAGVGATLVGLAMQAKEAASSIAEIGTSATMAGVSFKVFQELSYVAEQARIPVDALTDGLKEMSLRADEFAATGAGSAAEAFQRLGMSREEVKARLKDPAALFVVLIERTRQLGDTAAGVRIFDELFGGEGGERMVALLKQGAAGIREQIRAANELGVVLDDDVIVRSQEIEAQFARIARVVEINLKGAIVGSTLALEDFFDRFNDRADQNARNQKRRIEELQSAQARLRAEIEQARDAAAANPGNSFLAGEVARLEARLADLAKQEAEAQAALDRLTGAAKQAAPPVSTLGSAISGAGASAAKAGMQFASFADGIRALSKEIPELAAKMEDLDARTKIDETYRATVAKAGSYQEITEAKRLRDEAIKALDARPAREAASGGILDLIGYVEGTDKGRKYNETLGYGKFTGGPVNLTGMTLDEIDALQGKMLAHPENTFNSSAVGRYQITRTTLRGLRDQLGLKGDDYYTPELQDRLAQELLRRRGPDPAALRNEWEGLRRVDDDTIMGALNGTTLPPVDPSVTATRQSSAAVQALIASLEEELRLVGETDQARRAAEASRLAGASATEEERQKIIGLNEAIYQEQEARDKAAEAVQFQKDALNGFLSDLRNGASIGDAFANVLSKIADRLQGELVDALFEVGKAQDEAGSSGGGGLVSGLLSGGSGILSGIGDLFSGLFASAKDNVFSSPGLHAYANSVVSRPTVFPFAKGGVGLMGEAGPEAIMPLSRDPSGRLGVAVQGGSQSGAQAQAVQVTSDVRVRVTNDGELQAFVERTATRHVAAAAPGIAKSAVKASDARAARNVALAQARAARDYRS